MEFPFCQKHNPVLRMKIHGSITLTAKCSFLVVCQTPVVFHLLIAVTESLVPNKLKTDKTEQNWFLVSC